MNPKRGEIWLVNLDPTLGAEIKKTRPVIVVSSDFMGKLPLKLVVPITDSKPSYLSNIWHIYLEPNQENGLLKPSVADTLQMRSLDLQRFIRKIGVLSPFEWQNVITAIAAIIEYEPKEDNS